MASTATEVLQCGLAYDSTSGDFATCQGAACTFWNQDVEECMIVQLAVALVNRQADIHSVEREDFDV